MDIPIDLSHDGPALPFLRRFLSPDGAPFAVGVALGDGWCAASVRELIVSGWGGLLTEAAPSLFQPMQDLYFNCTGVTCLNVACGPVDGVLSFDDHAVQICRLTDLLVSSGCPYSFGVLAIGPGQPAMDILDSLDLQKFRPAILLVPDDEPDLAIRHGLYRRLVKLGFRFCATTARASVWRSDGVAGPAPLAHSASPFSRSDPVLPVAPGLPVPAFAIDRPALPPGRLLKQSGSGSLCLEGWVFDASSDPSSTVMVEFVQAKTGLAHHVRAARTARADVAAFFGKPQLIESGFQAEIAIQQWEPGRYAMNLIVMRGGEPRACAAPACELEVTLHDFESLARSGLAARFLSGSGIEIGALQRQLPLPAGCEVKYVDRMPLEELIQHYPELEGMPLQAPDLVDDGELLLSIAGASQDFVIANHFFEHSQNPIRTLMNFARVLVPGGVLFMAVPDKRFTRDVRRPETPYQELLEAFQNGHRRHTDRPFREWAEHWEGATGGRIAVRAEELEKANYSIHYNVWTLSGLLEFLLGAQRDAQVPFEMTAVVSSENEVILILTRLPA